MNLPNQSTSALFSINVFRVRFCVLKLSSRPEYPTSVPLPSTSTSIGHLNVKCRSDLQAPRTLRRYSESTVDSLNCSASTFDTAVGQSILLVQLPPAILIPALDRSRSRYALLISPHQAKYSDAYHNVGRPRAQARPTGL